MWFIAALPAEAAEDRPLNSIISPPLYYTFGVNSFSLQSFSVSLWTFLPYQVV